MLRSVITIAVLLLSLSTLLGGCGDDQVTDAIDSGPDDSNSQCNIPASSFADGGVGKDGIPALTDPTFTPPAQADNYLDEFSRVIGLLIDGEAVAIPHNILWWHEIINFNFSTQQLAVTYCPLTGSSIAFDRDVIDGAEFGVSGLLFQNNLTMYDRRKNDSLWPQMSLQAGCGPATGKPLKTVAVFDMSWSGWKDLHPATKVLSSDTGHNRNYTQTGYPYGDYERENNRRLLFSQTIDTRRPPKERLLGIPGSDGGIAFPFNELDTSPVKVVQDVSDGREIAVFWSRNHVGAAAFSRTLNSQRLSFSVENEQIKDLETGSTWRLDGLAVDGPLAGQRLEAIPEAFVAFWFAWAAFSPDTRIWTSG